MSGFIEFIQMIGGMMFGIVTAVVAIALMILLLAAPFIAIGGGIAIGVKAVQMVLGG